MKMKKFKLLPFMAYRGMKQNAIVYYPYIAAYVFSVFTYYTFSSLLYNDLMARLPHSGYTWMMLEIGKGLLAVILLPFLLYAGSFLQKRRQTEMGLYSLLGMEKKHIGVMLLWEHVGVFGFFTLLGIGVGAVLNKLLFLILLRMSHLDVEAEFVLSVDAMAETAKYFGIVTVCLYVRAVWTVYRARPAELLAGSRRGEKEPRHIWLWSLLGIILLGQGYQISVFSKLDNMIFTNFFLAVFFVVLGTYFLFTSGSVAFLRMLKRKKRFYYRPANQVTVSGMLYRMKKNAAGLANICIFSTMLLITLTCTVALWIGMEEISYFDYPYDVEAKYSENSSVIDLAQEKADELAEKYGQNVARLDYYNVMRLSCGMAAGTNRFVLTEGYSFADQYGVILMLLEDYNRIEQDDKSLEEGEIFVYSTGAPFGFDTVDFMGVTAKVKGELERIYPYPQAKNRMFNFSSGYALVVKDEEQLEKFVTAWAKQNGVTDMEAFLHSGVRYLGLLLDCDEEQKEAFTAEWSEWCQGQEAFLEIENGVYGRKEDCSMNGGLLFIGMMFGTVFFICLLLIMYFKQVSEGYEDQGSFAIMQKVGMSHEEIRVTVRRQILLVFFLPLAGALLHTTAGMFMINSLLMALRFFDTKLLIRCCVGVAAGFTLLYTVSYLLTARTYYKIVR